MRSASRSNGTWTRKKGVRRKATRPSCRLHRPGSGACPSRAKDDPRIRRGHRQGSRDPRTRRGESGGSPGEVQRVDRSIRADWGSDSPAHGQVDDQLSGRAFRRHGKVRGDQGQSRSRAMVSLAQKTREADSRSSPRGDSDRPRRADVSPRTGRTRSHPGPFTPAELSPYRTAREPPCQCEALNRRKVMRKARSKKKRPILLAELERRYRETLTF